MEVKLSKTPEIISIMNAVKTKQRKTNKSLLSSTKKNMYFKSYAVSVCKHSKIEKKFAKPQAIMHINLCST